MDKKIDFYVGRGKSDISFSNEIFPDDGFNGINDTPVIRAVLLKAGELKTIIMTIDATSISEDHIKKFKFLIRQDIEIDENNIWISASHSFNIPHIKPMFALKSEEEIKKNNLVIQAYTDAVKNTVLQLTQTLEPAKIANGNGLAYVNCNRDIETKDGWWLGHNETGISDKNLKVIQFSNQEGKIIAMIANYAVQSSVLHESLWADGYARVSGDLFGYASNIWEEKYPDAIALFLIGAAADQAPLLKSKRTIMEQNGEYKIKDFREKGIVLLNVLGERLGMAAVLISDKTDQFHGLEHFEVNNQTILCTGKKMPENTHEIKPVRNFEYVNTEEQQVPVMMIRINDVFLIGVQPEVSCQMGIELANEFPDKSIMLCTMVNGAAKYMTSEKSYELYQYEAINSKYAKGSAENLQKAIKKYINKYCLEDK